jgi:hypothetical protein
MRYRQVVDFKGAKMMSESLKVYAPCTVHRLWHDAASTCFLCVCEAVDKAPLPEVDDVNNRSIKPDPPTPPQKQEPATKKGPVEPQSFYIGGGKA